MALTFDTGKAIRKLRERGMEQNLAEATVEVVDEAVGEVVTKEYLRNEFQVFESRMDARFEKMRADIERANNRTILATSGIIIAGVGAIVTLVQIFGN